jgi:hypothetical protein
LSISVDGAGGVGGRIAAAESAGDRDAAVSSMADGTRSITRASVADVLGGGEAIGVRIAASAPT